MKSRIQSVVSSWRQLFGFLILALMIQDGSCRASRLKAQDEDLTIKTNFCNREYYEATYGVNWHIYWAAHFCWLYTGEQEPVVIVTTGDPQPKTKPEPDKKRTRMFAVRGR